MSVETVNRVHGRSVGLPRVTQVTPYGRLATWSPRASAATTARCLLPALQRTEETCVCVCVFLPPLRLRSHCRPSCYINHLNDFIYLRIKLVKCQYDNMHHISYTHGYIQQWARFRSSEDQMKCKLKGPGKLSIFNGDLILHI